MPWREKNCVRQREAGRGKRLLCIEVTWKKEPVVNVDEKAPDWHCACRFCFGIRWRIVWSFPLLSSQL